MPVPPKKTEPDRVRQGWGSVLLVISLMIFIIFLGSAENIILLFNEWLENL